jgi:hypothetical protein
MPPRALAPAKAFPLGGLPRLGVLLIGWRSAEPVLAAPWTIRDRRAPRLITS